MEEQKMAWFNTLHLRQFNCLLPGQVWEGVVNSSKKKAINANGYIQANTTILEDKW